MKQNLIRRFNDVFTARIIFIPYYISLLIIFPIIFLLKIFRRSKIDLNYKPRICLEAGIKGWELIEFKELYQSTCEYVGEDNVFKVQIDRSKDYYSQLKAAVAEFHPTHYAYDPRTGSQDAIPGIWEAIKLSFLFNWQGTVPVVILTDLSMRLQRCKAAIVSNLNGVVITYLSFKVTNRIFPHNRVIGPHLMPLSSKTCVMLQLMSMQDGGGHLGGAVFTGSLYEPRTSQLNSIRENLEKKNLTLEIKGRPLGSARFPDSDYWGRLVHAKIVVTTADQVRVPGMDWAWVPSLIYRYLEVMASGSLLVAPEVPGSLRFFIPGTHYISFDSPEEAANSIEYYLKNEEERRKIARMGNEQAIALIKSRTYWKAIDMALGKNSLT